MEGVLKIFNELWNRFVYCTLYLILYLYIYIHVNKYRGTVFVKVSLMWVLYNKKNEINERKRHKNTYKIAKKTKKLLTGTLLCPLTHPYIYMMHKNR